MNNWKTYTKNIGQVKQNTRKEITFESNIPLDISRVEPGCSSCTKFLDYKDNILTVRYEAGSFPMHLKEAKQSIINKSITVYYENGTSDTLKFVGFLIP